MKWYLKAIKQYADFSGRARRKEYWMFTLFNTLFATVCIMLSQYGIFYTLYILFAIIPSLAVAVRRLHDIGKSGWFNFIAFIPFGGIVLLIWFCQDSQVGTNKWGKNPKGIERDRNYDMEQK